MAFQLDLDLCPYHVDIDNRVTCNYNELHTWLESLDIDYSRTMGMVNTFYFKRSEDALSFKLRFKI